MSVKQMAKVWDCSPLKAEKLLIHLSIADHMDHDGVGWVSWSQIVKKARVGRSTVARTMRWLQEHGWLEVVKPQMGTRPPVYRMVWPELVVPQRDPSRSGTRPAEGARGPADDALGVSELDTHSIPTPSNAPSIHMRNAQNAHTDAHGFETFWETATVKKDKARARKAYETALTLTDPDTLHKAWQTANRAWSQWVTDDPASRRYIPMPSTWLNGERWDDDPPNPNQQASSTQTKPSKFASLVERNTNGQSTDSATGGAHRQLPAESGPS